MWLILYITITLDNHNDVASVKSGLNQSVDHHNGIEISTGIIESAVLDAVNITEEDPYAAEDIFSGVDEDYAAPKDYLAVAAGC